MIFPKYFFPLSCWVHHWPPSGHELDAVTSRPLPPKSSKDSSEVGNDVTPQRHPAAPCGRQSRCRTCNLMNIKTQIAPEEECSKSVSLVSNEFNTARVAPTSSSSWVITVESAFFVFFVFFPPLHAEEEKDVGCQRGGLDQKKKKKMEKRMEKMRQMGRTGQQGRKTASCSLAPPLIPHPTP